MLVGILYYKHVSIFNLNESIAIQDLAGIEFSKEVYLGWLRDIKNNRFIESVRVDYTLFELETYLKTKIDAQNIKFWGIFLGSNKFIGTIKLEPIDWENRTAWLGMMIGDPSERGKGYGSQALNLVLNYAEKDLLLKEIFLGVHRDNTPAIRIYTKSGFEMYKVNESQITMKRELTTPSEL